MLLYTLDSTEYVNVLTCCVQILCFFVIIRILIPFHQIIFFGIIIINIKFLFKIWSFNVSKRFFTAVKPKFYVNRHRKLFCLIITSDLVDFKPNKTICYIAIFVFLCQNLRVLKYCTLSLLGNTGASEIRN